MSEMIIFIWQQIKFFKVYSKYKYSTIIEGNIKGGGNFVSG